MGSYIPENFINDLIARVNIGDIIAEHGVELRKSGNDLIGCCPFHNEKTPSFNISLSKQVYHCFGCGAGGGVVQFIREYNGVDFVTAIENLAARCGVTVPYTKKHVSQEVVDLYTINDLAAQFFIKQLKQHATKDSAVNYLKSRRISGSTAKNFGIGFAPDGWKNLYSYVGNNKELQQQLQKSGLIISKENSNNYYDRFRNRIMFPIRDKKGKIIGFGGRDLPSVNNNNSNVKYINSPETSIFKKGEELYGLYEARCSNRKLDRILVVEGYFDVVVLANAGITNAVASLGTAITASHIKTIFNVTQEIVFCFDGDTAGRTAAWRSLKICLPLLQDGFLVKFLLLPEGSDPDSYVCDNGAEKFLQILDRATSLPDFMFSELSKNIELHSVDGKAQLVRQANPVINTVGSYVLKQLLHNRLTELTGIDTQVRENHNNINTINNKQKYHKANRRSNVTYFSTPELRAIAILLHKREMLSQLPDLSKISKSNSKEVQLFYAITNILLSNSGENLDGIQKLLPINLAKLLTHYELDSIIAAIPADGMQQEFLYAINRMIKKEQEYNLERLLDKSQGATLSEQEKVTLRTILEQQG